MIENLKYAAIPNLPDLNGAVHRVFSGASSIDTQSLIETGIVLHIPMLRSVRRR
jgi:hypothetical protein